MRRTPRGGVDVHGLRAGRAAAGERQVERRRRARPRVGQPVHDDLAILQTGKGRPPSPGVGGRRLGAHDALAVGQRLLAISAIVLICLLIASYSARISASYT